MTYADYTYYSGVYMGTVSSGDFPRLAVRASSFLDYFTQNRAKDNVALDAVKMCCCALVANDAEVKSETVGGYSRTLATGGESAVSALNATDGARKLLAETCMEYLAHTGLLYRGRGCGSCTLPTL